MNRLFFSGKFSALALSAFVLFGVACNSSTTHNETTNNTITQTGDSAVDAANAASSGSTPSDTAGLAPGVKVDTALTLPVLDALFYEPGFADELKTKLALTDEELKKIRTVSHSSVSDLDEQGDGTAYLESARDAAQKANAQLAAILGPQKAQQLHQLVANRYAGGNLAGLLPSQPNSIPKDTRIVVNAPTFRMDVFQDGNLVKTYRVGIGYPQFPLPAGMRRAESIIFNPTWTPPNEPWVRGRFAPGKVVAAGSRDNPLGPIKIPIGQPSLIHGGKQPYKLGTFASHGCVGLTNEGIQDFAATLAQVSGHSDFTMDSVKTYGKNRSKTRTEKLGKAIPVELRYETIIAENGNLVIYRDVYERGTNTIDYANKVLAAYGLNYEGLPAAEKAELYRALDVMNHTAGGKKIAANFGGNGAPPPAATDTTAGAKTPKAKGKTTSKAPKQMSVAIAGLAGRGYPEPVNLVGGTVAKTDKPAAKP